MCDGVGGIACDGNLRHISSWHFVLTFFELAVHAGSSCLPTSAADVGIISRWCCLAGSVLLAQSGIGHYLSVPCLSWQLLRSCSSAAAAFCCWLLAADMSYVTYDIQYVLVTHCGVSNM